MYKPQTKVAPHTSRTLNFVTGRSALVIALSLVFTLALTCTPAVAQDRNWQVDSQYSFARLSFGSGGHTQPLDTAAVSGKVIFDQHNPADPVVDVTFKPGSGLGQQYSAISFKSKRTEFTRDGKPVVVGDLTVTTVQPSATWNPGEAYSGPDYGAPVVHTVSREVTLLFPGMTLPVAQNGAIRLAASTTINREDFPELFADLQSSDEHASVANDVNCTVPSTVSEDYSGLTCTATPVPTATGNFATLTLELKLVQPTPTSAASSGEDAPAGH